MLNSFTNLYNNEIRNLNFIILELLLFQQLNFSLKKIIFNI